MDDISLPSLPFPVSFHSADEIRLHPHFAEARTAFLDATFTLYEGNAFLNRLLVEASRQIAFNLIVSFYFRHDEADRNTWATVRQLKSAMAAFGLLSGRRLDRLVSQFIRSGFLELQPVPVDRRVRILTPTAKMIALDQDWLVINYKPLHVIFPDGGYSRFIERDPAMQRAQRITALGFGSHAAKIMDSNPSVMRFLNRDAGSMVLYKLMQLTTRPGAFPKLSYAEIGTKFGVSRTHVRKLLEEAEEHGDLILHGRGGRYVELQPSLLQAFDRFLADIMSGNDLLFKLALTLWKCDDGSTGYGGTAKEEV